MAKYIHQVVVVLSVLVLAAGCSKSQDSTRTEAPNAGSASTNGAITSTSRSPANPTSEAPVLVARQSATHEVKSLPANTAPDLVVTEFLAALRTGDDSMAELLLTQRARNETAKNDLAVLPPGAPTAKFQVGDVQMTPDGNGARVPCIWTERFDDGSEESYEITWAMRSEPTGWRIAGMATQIVPGQLPLFLNFEEPADMMAKLHDAQQRVTETPNGPIRQAQVPSATGTGTR